MKRTLLPMLLLCLMLTGCAQVNVPPADYDEPAAAVTAAASETETETETETEKVTETTRKRETTKPSKPKKKSDDEDETETETETKPLEIPAWAKNYASLLRMKDKSSEHISAYYALIRLDADEIPELVILDDVQMEIYYYQEDTKSTELLLEDGYKGEAAEDANVCYQPMKGRLASAFSTMGGGSGYYFFFYDKMDPASAERYCFDNNEDKDGEMPYNDIWDRAEEFDITNNGYHDVTLGDSWTPIGKDFEDIRKLKAADAETLTVDWLHILDDIHETEERSEDETDEEETETRKKK